MNVRTIAVPAVGFSGVLSLLGLNISDPIGIGFAKTLTSSDVFNVFGTLDSAAVDDTNATSIGQISGSAGANLDPILVKRMLMWPCVILERVSGAGAGNFEACGNLDAAPAVASVALPAVGAYTTLIDLTGFDATVRLGTSRQQTTNDVFDVYVTNDSTTNPAVTGVAGALYAGRIAGGGESTGILASLVVQGYGYAFFKRVSGSTAGNALAAGSSVPATSGTAWLIGGNTLPAGTQVLGTLNAGADFRIVAGGVDIFDSDGTTTTMGSNGGANAIGIGAGSGDLVLNVDNGGNLEGFTDTGEIIFDTQGGAIRIGTVVPVAKTIFIGNTTGASSVTIDGGTGGILIGTNAVAQTVAIGNSTGASAVTVTAGTGGFSLSTAGVIDIGANAAAQTITIGNSTGATSVAINGGTGAMSFGANAAAHAVTIGSITGAASLAIRAGTGGLTIVNNGVTWTWPTAVGAAGTKLTDAAGNGVLSWT